MEEKAATQPLINIRRGFTLRSVIIGAALSALLNIACPYCVLIMHNAGLTSDYITAGAVMLFFILVCMLNPLLKKFFPRFALSSSELVLIYIMMIVASAIPTWGLVTNMFHILTRPFYYATPENQWENLFLHYIPSWIAPRERYVSRWFYEGSPPGKGIPWGPWVVPIFWWCALMINVYLVMISSMVIMRKQWVEHERLAFPIIQPALEMVRGNDENIINPLFRNKLMWIPFVIVFCLVSTSGINHYFPSFPELKMRTNMYLFRRSTRLILYLNFAILGLTYFINLDVAASFWVFHLLNRIETGVFNITGFKLSGHNEALCGSSAATSHQGLGAMIVLVVVALWSARKHLKSVLKKAFMNDPSVDDSSEIMSYRAAVITLILSYTFVLGWYVKSGMPLLGAIAFTVGAFGIFFAITRIVAQGGVGFTCAQMIPQPFVVYSFGSEFLGPSGLTSLSFTYAYAAEMRTSVMTSSMNGLKLADAANARGRPLFWAIIIAIISGLAGAIWITLTLNYHYGGANLRVFGVPRIAFNFLVDKLRHPVREKIIIERWTFTFIGAAVMSLLVFMRNRFIWFPVHYVGFAIGDAWVMGWAWGCVFLGWLIKLLIIKLGGQTWYNKLKPVFIGMILGQLMCGAFWIIVDLITGEVGNFIYIGVP